MNIVFGSIDPQNSRATNCASQMAKIVINFNNLKVLEINYDIAHGAKTTEHPFAHNSRNKFFATTTTTATIFWCI